MEYLVLGLLDKRNCYLQSFNDFLKKSFSFSNVFSHYKKFEEMLYGKNVFTLSPAPKEINFIIKKSQKLSFWHGPFYFLTSSPDFKDSAEQLVKDYFDLLLNIKIQTHLELASHESLPISQNRIFEYVFNEDELDSKEKERINNLLKNLITSYKKKLSLLDEKKVSEKVKDESYYLMISPIALGMSGQDEDISPVFAEIFIIAQTNHGLFNGFQTLLQILQICYFYSIKIYEENPLNFPYLAFTKEKASLTPEELSQINQVYGECYKNPFIKVIPLPHIEVFDYPDLEIRGISDDHSRGQVPTVDNVKEFITHLSRFKLNTYMFYLEDMFRFSSFPEIGKNRSAWTYEEIEEIDRYAQVRYVDLVPIFNSLGHMETYFWVHKFWKYAEYPGSACIDISSEESRAFLETLYREIAPAFRSTSFHIGADESREVGWYRSKAYIENKGKGNAYLDHYTFLINLLVKLGKERIYLYHDIASRYEEVLKNLPRERAVFVFWDYGYQEHYSRLDVIAKHKLPFVVSSSIQNWSRIFPDLEVAFRTNYRLIEEGIRYGTLGEICSSWGDNGNESLRPNRLLPFAASATMAWNHTGFSKENFLKTYFMSLWCLNIEDLPEFNEVWEFLYHFHRNMDFSEEELHNLIEIEKKSKATPGYLWEDEEPDYHLLKNNNPFRDFYPHLWRHPFARFHHGSPDDLAGISYFSSYKKSFSSKIEKIISLLRTYSEKALRNQHYFEYMIFSLAMTRTFIKKIQLTKHHDYYLEGLYNKETLLDEIQDLIDDFSEKKSLYESLWKRCAKIPRLPKILEYFDNMILWLKERNDEIRKDLPYHSPMLLGDWLYYSEEGEKTDEPRYFKGEFVLEESDLKNIKRVVVQVIGGLYTELFINDSLITTTPSPQSTDLPLDLGISYHTLDLSHLKSGLNTVIIKSTVWPEGWPMAHVLLYFEFQDKQSRVFTTDMHWKSSKSKEGPWKRAQTLGRTPEGAGEIYMPHFSKNLPSMKILRNFMGLARSIASPLNKAPISEFYIRIWRNNKLFY